MSVFVRSRSDERQSIMTWLHIRMWLIWKRLQVPCMRVAWSPALVCKGEPGGLSRDTPNEKFLLHGDFRDIVICPVYAYWAKSDPVFLPGIIGHPYCGYETHLSSASFTSCFWQYRSSWVSFDEGGHRYLVTRIWLTLSFYCDVDFKTSSEVSLVVAFTQSEAWIKKLRFSLDDVRLMPSVGPHQSSRAYPRKQLLSDPIIQPLS